MNVRAGRLRVSRSRPRADSVDRGSSFIEILVSIVLLGTVIIGTLAALRSTIIATAIERDHSKAHEWLQSASEILTDDASIMWLDCDTPLTGTDIANQYETSLQTGFGSVVPEGWAASQISIVGDVTFAQASGAYGSTCIAEIDRQLMTVRVTDDDGDIVEEAEIVKAAP